MRIALLSWESMHSIAVGGVAPHITELAAALDRIGHEVHVFTRAGQGQPQHEIVDGVQYHRCPFDFDSNFVTEMNNMCHSFAYHLFKAEDRSGTFDIVHGHDWMTVNALAEIRSARQKKTVFTLHSTEYGRCGNVFHEGQSRDIRNLEWYGGYIADRVIITSETIKNEAKWIYQFPEKKIALIPNGVSIRKFICPLDPGSVKVVHNLDIHDPISLFVGRMVVQKGPDLLLEAVPQVLAEFPAAKFLFVGDGNMRWGLEHRAWQLGIQHACRFLGYVQEPDLVNFYNACDMVCIPSRNEPFGIVALEAWAAGKPIVVTHNGFDFVRHDINGLKVYDHPDSIAWGLKMMLADPVQARRMGTTGQKTAESFSWDTIARKTANLYEDILRR
jgi:glycosyltransferase involved in cell wall biosynthesis